jgi:hypothetical protein
LSLSTLLKKRSRRAGVIHLVFASMVFKRASMSVTWWSRSTHPFTKQQSKTAKTIKTKQPHPLLSLLSIVYFLNSIRQSIAIRFAATTGLATLSASMRSWLDTAEHPVRRKTKSIHALFMVSVPM